MQSVWDHIKIIPRLPTLRSHLVHLTEQHILPPHLKSKPCLPMLDDNLPPHPEFMPCPSLPFPSVESILGSLRCLFSLLGSIESNCGSRSLHQCLLDTLPQKHAQTLRNLPLWMEEKAFTRVWKSQWLMCCLYYEQGSISKVCTIYDTKLYWQ